MIQCCIIPQSTVSILLQKQEYINYTSTQHFCRLVCRGIQRDLTAELSMLQCQPASCMEHLNREIKHHVMYLDIKAELSFCPSPDAEEVGHASCDDVTSSKKWRFLPLFTLAAVISLIIPAIDSKTSVHPDKRLINMIQFSYFNAVKYS